MNAMLAHTSVLPAVLPTTARAPRQPGLARRHSIGGFNPGPYALDRFNVLLERLGREQGPIDCDQLATAARELCGCSTTLAAAAIGVRMRRAAVVDTMIADRNWQAANDAMLVGAAVIDYVRGNDDLIPDAIPRVGRLDDAIVVDSAWPRLSDEVAAYADYRRLRRIEAALRGCDAHAFAFDRSDWREARQAEAALTAHRARVRDSAYLPAPSALFRIH